MELGLTIPLSSSILASRPCIQKDAFNGLIPKIKAADCIVFASPLYFWTLSARIKAFIERFYCIAEEDPAPPLGRYKKYPVKDCALFITSADDFFWTLQQAQSYYQFALVSYIGFHDRGMLLAGGFPFSVTADNAEIVRAKALSQLMKELDAGVADPTSYSEDEVYRMLGAAK